MKIIAERVQLLSVAIISKTRKVWTAVFGIEGEEMNSMSEEYAARTFPKIALHYDWVSQIDSDNRID